MKSGPLAGVRVLELSGIGPAPFASMMLADMGADVVAVIRPTMELANPPGIDRGKRSILVDLTEPDGAALVRALASAADVVIDPFRPGVAERLRVGPEECMRDNDALIYARMTGWGQDGPRAKAAGHDLTYIGLTGALAAIGPADGPPVPPLALVGDLGGGAMFLLAGVLAALVEAGRSGQGQIVDAAIVDGAAALMTPFYTMLNHGLWKDARESNILDGGRPWYRCYGTSDGRWVAVGAIEERFWNALLDGLGIARDAFDRRDRACWSRIAETFAASFATEPRDHWTAVFDSTDACVAPVLDMHEAPSDPHLAARGTFVDTGSGPIPAPAPRFSRTPSAAPTAVREPMADSGSVLEDWGITAAAAGATAAPEPVG